MPDYDSLHGFVTLDFRSTFPHKFWISTWSSDEQYPGGFRYKVLSVRPEPDGLIELVVLLEEPLGVKTEMSRLRVSASLLDRAGETFISRLASNHGLQFSEVDLTDVRSEEEFVLRVTRIWWSAVDVH